MSSSEQYSEWKALLTELLAAIAKRLTSIADYASFRGVCRSWRSAAPFHNFDRKFPRAPRLIYFVEETPVLGDDEESEETLVPGKLVTNILDLESNTFQITNFPPPPRKYYPSCSGWILVSEDTQVCLKHFLLGISIKLPGLNTLWDTFISKMVLSGSPIETDVLVMVIWGYDDQLAFCRPGDESWTAFDWDGINFYDIIYHNSKLYALDSNLRIFECDIHGSRPTRLLQVFAFPPNDEFGYYELQFLVESFGKFLIVLHCVSQNYISPIETHLFRVFEIELKNGSYKEIDNLGDRCVFLGLNSSFCVASSGVNLEPNCIYLANKRLYSWAPIAGVYKLGGGCFEDFSGMLGFKKCSRFPPPFWVVPII